MAELIKSLDHLAVFTRRFLEKLPPPSDRALVIGLSGELGSGKTALVKSLAKHLGVKQEIISPTFVILKRYPLTKQKFKNLIHIDCYRLKSAEELVKLNWQELILNPLNLIIIEWPERVSEILPRNHCRLFLRFISETAREIKVQKC